MILLDPREGSAILQRHIPSRHRVVSCHLDDGDASFIGHGPKGLVEAGVEVKHLSDVLQSLEDGRLPTKQILGMRKFYDYVFLLIQDRVQSDLYGHLQVWVPTGNRDDNKKRKGATPPELEASRPAKYDAPGYWHGYWADAMFGRRRRMMWIDFWKWVISLSVQGGVRLLWAGSNQEAGEVITAAYEWFQKQWSEHGTFKVFDESHMPPMLDPSVAMLVAHALVFGVGWEKAQLVADHFKTARVMINAGKREWMEVEGIGKTLAERFAKAADTVHVRRTVTGASGAQRRRGGRRND